MPGNLENESASTVIRSGSDSGIEPQSDQSKDTSEHSPTSLQKVQTGAGEMPKRPQCQSKCMIRYKKAIMRRKCAHSQHESLIRVIGNQAGVWEWYDGHGPWSKVEGDAVMRLAHSLSLATAQRKSTTTVL
eukprot:647637-Amphidinium_carterae.1